MLRILWVPLVVLAGCSGGDDGECIAVDDQCQPLYEPTFDEVFSRTLQPKCGVSGGACHSAEGRKNGLVFADADEAYDLLLDGRVEPGDPGCSLVVRRLQSSDADFAMPPGAPLSDQERCAVVKWIAQGAER